MKQLPDPDPFPTKPLEKVSPKPAETKEQDQWQEYKPGFYRNPQGQVKTKDMRWLDQSVKGNE